MRPSRSSTASGRHLSPEERQLGLGRQGRCIAQRLSSDAPGYFANVTRDTDLNDDLLAWKCAALRAGQWSAVRKAVDAMSEEARQDSTQYWKARALLAAPGGRAHRRSSSCKALQAHAAFMSSWRSKNWASASRCPRACAP
ncbi:MAG: hypothetical protein R3E55_08085 [Burkholderiaceae bacterium]